MGPFSTAPMTLQGKRHAEHPLAYGLALQYLIDQKRGAIDHAPRTAAWTEAAMFATKGDQLLGVTLATPDPQKAVFELPAFEIVIELALNEGRQSAALCIHQRSILADTSAMDRALANAPYELSLPNSFRVAAWSPSHFVARLE